MTPEPTDRSAAVAMTVRATRALHAAGLGDLIWGHAAVRDPDGRGVWMKSAEWGFEEVDAERVLLVASHGAVLKGMGRRHIEYPIHTEIMERRDDIGCVVHTHAPAVNAFSSLDVPVRAISHDGVLFTEPDVPRFTRTGGLVKTSEMGSALACLMPQHGFVSVGRTVEVAVMTAVILERACRVQLMAMSAGGPRRWSDLEELREKQLEIWPDDQLSAGFDYLIRTGNGRSAPAGGAAG